MLGGDPWILAIWGAANDAKQAGRVPPLTDELGQLGLHISIRLDLLPRIARRITKETSEVYKSAGGHKSEHVFSEGKRGYAFSVDDDAKFRLIADIDALLLEINACWELMRKLFHLVRAHIGAPIIGGRDTVTNELKVALGGSSDKWFGWLDRAAQFRRARGYALPGSRRDKQRLMGAPGDERTPYHVR